jgi:hypothetical protein
MHLFASVFIALILLAALVVVAALFRRSEGEPGADGRFTYEAVALLTPAERSFFGVLQQAVASNYQIFAKVRLADIVQPARSPTRSGWQSAFNRITGKHVDFVMCDSERLRVVGVVELDDSTHARFERGVRDGLVDSALADAGIPVLRIPARQSYSPVQIREQVESLFRSHQKPSDHAALHRAGANSHRRFRSDQQMKFEFQSRRRESGSGDRTSPLQR